jgi:Protein of unknown function DUF262
MSSALHKRPDATTYAIEDLVPMARRGTFRVPPLQRPFRWKVAHVRDLFDSIYRGFPIGTLLLWKKPAAAGHVQFGPLETPIDVEAEAQTDALWIVDGQQRVSSLLGVLAPSTEPAGVFRLFFDLAWEDGPEDRRSPTPFLPVSAEARASSDQVLLPMDMVLDSERLDAWLDDSGVRKGPPEHVRRARRLNKLIREYKIPAYVVETEDAEPLVTIFERVNNAGERLEQSDVFNALFRSAEEGYGLPDLGRRIGDLGFGELEQELLMRVVIAVHDGDTTNLTTELFRKISARPEPMRAAEEAIRRTIDFIRRDADIPHEALLPYTFPIIVLAKFFRDHPHPIPRSRALLSRWVWRGAITGEHRAERIPEVRAVLAGLNEASKHDEEAAVQMLMETVSRSRPSLEAHPFRFNSAKGRLDLLALASLGPRHLIDGDSTDLGPLFSRGSTRAAPLDVGPLFARYGARAVTTLWTGKDDASDAVERSLASVLIHPPIGRRLLMSALRSATPEVLMSHGIDAEAGDALRAHDDKHLIDLRGRRLREHVAAFLDAHARWGETDRPSLAFLTRKAERDERERDEQDTRA